MDLVKLHQIEQGTAEPWQQIIYLNTPVDSYLPGLSGHGPRIKGKLKPRQMLNIPSSLQKSPSNEHLLPASTKRVNTTALHAPANHFLFSQHPVQFLGVLAGVLEPFLVAGATLDQARHKDDANAGQGGRTTQPLTGHLDTSRPGNCCSLALHHKAHGTR